MHCKSDDGDVHDDQYDHTRVVTVDAGSYLSCRADLTQSQVDGECGWIWQDFTGSNRTCASKALLEEDAVAELRKLGRYGDAVKSVFPISEP